ncbi:hypothetical protein [Blastococcus sp. Marseille-P5729]|uniref:hypothetical protein n=1 Tax=Blastococcus sp. Marseille-P5729 TaxID=2086582 RepID=UPI000D0F86A8|nr:hypothetical protein [Blastococcus sp. Marseille-P5729]
MSGPTPDPYQHQHGGPAGWQPASVNQPGPQTGSQQPWGLPTQPHPQSGAWQMSPPSPPSRRRPWVPLAAIGGVLAIGLLVWLIVGLSPDRASDPEDYGLAAAQRESAPEVSQVTADAIAAAEDLDVEAGLDLLCQAPSSTDMGTLNEAIADGRAEAGGEDPEMSFTIVEVEQSEDGGSATVRVDGEGNIAGAFLVVELTMKQGSDGFCIDEVGVTDGSRAD